MKNTKNKDIDAGVITNNYNNNEQSLSFHVSVSISGRICLEQLVENSLHFHLHHPLPLNSCHTFLEEKACLQLTGEIFVLIRLWINSSVLIEKLIGCYGKPGWTLPLNYWGFLKDFSSMGIVSFLFPISFLLDQLDDLNSFKDLRVNS